MEVKPLFIDEYFYCPLCDSELPESIYLSSIFSNNLRAKWFANMVTHYRHNHTRYYDNSVGYVSKFHDYGDFKQIVNERAKRQIIRKTKEFMKLHEFTVDDIKVLEFNEDKTIELFNKLIN